MEELEGNWEKVNIPGGGLGFLENKSACDRFFLSLNLPIFESKCRGRAGDHVARQLCGRRPLSSSFLCRAVIATADIAVFWQASCSAGETHSLFPARGLALDVFRPRGSEAVLGISLASAS